MILSIQPQTQKICELKPGFYKSDVCCLILGLYNPGKSQRLKMIQTNLEWDAVCMVCEQAITNPICPHCFERQLVQWALVEDPELVPLIKNIVDATPLGNEVTYCIICGRKMHVCTFCMAEEFVELLKMERPELVESFAQNFGLEHHLEKHAKLMAM